MTELDSELASIQLNKRKTPLWEGPCSPGPNGGITFSMLNRFLQCKERFRIVYILGIKPRNQFDHKIEFGQMWHVCEEALASGSAVKRWENELFNYCKNLCTVYPTSQDQIDHWYNVVKVTFPIYVNYWKKHKDVIHRTPLFQERVFHVPYILPGGKVVYLRGKYDAVDIIKQGKVSKVYIQENKTKSKVSPQYIERQLGLDLQTMFYIVSLKKVLSNYKLKHDIGGVRYNVILRPLSGGKGTIVRKKPSKSNPNGETAQQYYSRLAQYIEDEPEEFFFRWLSEVDYLEVTNFKEKCLTPLLQHIVEWYSFITENPTYNPWSSGENRPNSLHWIHPYGLYNVLNEGGFTDLDEFITTGSEVGLTRIDSLFEELK